MHNPLGLPIGHEFYEAIARSTPNLRRGLVWCEICGRIQKVNSAECLHSGWPQCCGRTMTIDQPTELESVNPIYVVSKIQHAPRWRQLREEGLPIISTWIDDGEEAGIDFSVAWPRYLAEAASAKYLLVYVEEGETLKGGLLEIGAGLGSGAQAVIVGEVPQMRTANKHPKVIRVKRLEDALGLLPKRPDAT